MKIIVTEKISDKGVALLQAVPDFDVDVRFDIEREELLKIIPEYDAIVVRSVTKINEYRIGCRAYYRSAAEFCP